MKKLVLFGCGYTGRCFVAQEGHRFETITATVRNPSSAAPLPDNTKLVAFDGVAGTDALRLAVREADAVLVSIGPNETGDPVLNAFRDDLVAARHLKWIGYLSTIGVYGNRDGGWVSEEDVPEPVSERSRRRFEVEQKWLGLGSSLDVTTAIFRLSGIYGPGRNALLDLAEGLARRLIKPGQVFNRIHVEDIALTLGAAISRPQVDGIFNVTDDEPCPPQDVVSYAASLLGCEPPPAIPFETATLSPMARSFYGENKRVSNTRIKSELAVSLNHPTYREGYRSLLARGEGQAA